MSWNEPPDRTPPAGDAWRKSPGKKDTKRWCKGKVGREHVPSIRVSNFLYPEVCYARPADNWLSKVWGTNWSCHHELACVLCGKILKNPIDKSLCPDWTPEKESTK